VDSTSQAQRSNASMYMKSVHEDMTHPSLYNGSVGDLRWAVGIR
jgi:hypothetical protein